MAWQGHPFLFRPALVAACIAAISATIVHLTGVTEGP